MAMRAQWYMAFDSRCWQAWRRITIRLSGPLGDGPESRQNAQRGVVTSLQGIPGFCEQRGEDDPAHFRQGCEDLRVLLSKNRVEKVQGQFRMLFDDSL